MPILYIVGMPLNDEGNLSEAAVSRINESGKLIGENRKQAARYFRKSGVQFREGDFLWLDKPNQREQALALVAENKDLDICLISDTGMPVLFDPGKEILALAALKNYEIRSLPSAQSWSAACALSGLQPPFHIEGFLPQKTPLRLARLKELTQIHSHIVLMETPYRFSKILTEIEEIFGSACPVFLAWEIGSEREILKHLTVKKMIKWTLSNGMKKGEFVLLINNTHE